MDEYFLSGVGKIWKVKDYPADVVKNKKIKQIVASVSSHLTSESPRSVLISGAKGVGKSTLIQMISRELKARKWSVFVAKASDLMAGQRYIGDLEQNVKQVIEALTDEKKAIWVVPNFEDLYYGGQHQYSRTGILDYIWPYVESGELKVVGEIDSSSLERLVQVKPQVATAFELIRIEASSRDFTLQLAKEWARSYANEKRCEELTDEDLVEVYEMCNQYLTQKENPGGMMDLLRQSAKLTLAKGGEEAKMRLSDIMDSLSSITGLPGSILNDDEKLQMDTLTSYFTERVVGQEDAVETMVERIAMIKAGLTDPGKPAGVFLFVGPTGTGKTEIAKSLAEYLFGSKDRLLRLDMSEFQTYDSTLKILGGNDQADGGALTDNIRKNPFSVVLLDEFEKAHVNIWDLFLQVFDDGRLTDMRGSVADFRHCIIILTSNLGASIPQGSRIGFGDSGDEPIDRNVMKAIEQTFRPEFVNRLDKIVVFKPLTRSVSKRILKGELKKVLKRRGLRRRGWELDFEDSALEFLLDKGFSSTLGARPLKRAVESYLLAPLAKTIVNHSFPKGNQFLLVSAGKNKLKVDFIDPDEPEFTWEQKQKIVASQKEKSLEAELKDVILDPKGILAEFKLIEKKLKELNRLIDETRLEASKDGFMSLMGQPDFWEKEERYEVLSKVELIDSVLSATETARSLFDRLHDPQKERLSYDARLLRKLAQRIFLLLHAMEAYGQQVPQDAFLKLQFEAAHAEQGAQMETMYRSWARLRGMKLEEINRWQEAGEHFLAISITGFGAYQLLLPEMGHHVFEESTEEGKSVKGKVKVLVIPMQQEDHRLKNMSTVLARFQPYEQQKNVRRYRFGKSPLVRDLKAGWQTGKLDRVLGGDFDLFG